MIFSAKKLGIETVQNLSFIHRPGIVWQWNAPLFNGCVFGTKVGPINCFFTGGLHDFAHAVDFILRGKPRRITSYGFIWRRAFIKRVSTYLGILEEGEPKTAQITNCEAKVFALQAYFMHRELGFIVETLDYDDEQELRERGELSEFPVRNNDSTLYWEKENQLLKKVTIEEYSQLKGELVQKYHWEDSHNFLKERGINTSKMTLDERDLVLRDEFAKAVAYHYECCFNPFTERRISKAITAVGKKVRRHQKSLGFTFDPSIHFRTI